MNCVVCIAKRTQQVYHVRCQFMIPYNSHTLTGVSLSFITPTWLPAPATCNDMGTAHWSEGSLVRRFVGPKVRWFENAYWFTYVTPSPPLPSPLSSSSIYIYFQVSNSVIWDTLSCNCLLYIYNFAYVLLLISISISSIV